MKAAIHERYGSPATLVPGDAPAPALGDHDILVAVHASPVTQGDRRLRAADFPGIGWLPGRLMTGLVRPRHRVPGTAFAGRVVAVGRAVTRFAPGDDVFGAAPHGAHAEYLAVAEDGPVAKTPAGFAHDEVAAAPYEALTALVFLCDLGQLRAGERVLVIGAAGAVGRSAVQLAKHLGAEVTAVSSADDAALVRSLGADRVIVRTEGDITETIVAAIAPDTGADGGADGSRHDLVLDTVGAARFGRLRQALAPGGRFLSLHLQVRVLLWALWSRLPGSRAPQATFGVAMASAERLERVRELFEAGAFRPRVEARYPLARIAEAHTHVDAGRPRGSVVLTIAGDDREERRRGGRVTGDPAAD